MSRSGSTSSESGHIRGLVHQPALLDGVDFTLAHQLDGRKYPALKRALSEARKGHVARAIKQTPVSQLGVQLLRLRAQLDATVDHGLQGGCGFVAVVAPEAPAQQVIGNLCSLECGVSLYKFTVRTAQEGSAAQLHQEAKTLVKRLFESAIERGVERTCGGAKPPAAMSFAAADLDLDSGSSYYPRSPLGSASNSGTEYVPPDQKICSWADKPSLRAYLEQLGASPTQLFRLGFFVPPLQTGYVDGASCKFAAYALDDRPVEGEFTFALLVDGGSALGNIMLRNACIPPDSQSERPSLDRLRPVFESAREYSDLARDAQAFVLIAWMRRAFDQANSDAGRWTLSLPDSKFFTVGDAEQQRVYFAEPFVVNHYNSLVPFAEAVSAADEHGRALGGMCPPDALRLYKSLQSKASAAVRSSAGIVSSSYVVAPSASSAPAPGSPALVAGQPEASDAQSRARLRELLKQKKIPEISPRNFENGGAPSALAPQHPLYQRLGTGGRSVVPSQPGGSSGPQTAFLKTPLAELADNPRCMAFFQQSTAVAISSGGLLVQSPLTQRAFLFLASFKVGARDFYDVVRSDRSTLVDAGVYSPDKRCDALPNLDLGHVQGAFPRFLPTSGQRDLATEAHDRAFPPPPGTNDLEEEACLTDAMAYLSDQPFVQQVVTRTDKVCCFVHTYTLTCLAMHCDSNGDGEEQRKERQPWARALYEHFAHRDYATQLRSETLARREFLRGAMEYTCANDGARSDFFPYDHYVVSTSPDFLGSVVSERLPSARIHAPGQHHGSAPMSDRPIQTCVLQHYKDGTPLPGALWDVLGDETVHRVRILPQVLNVDSLHRTLANWTQ